MQGEREGRRKEGKVGGWVGGGAGPGKVVELLVVGRAAEMIPDPCKVRPSSNDLRTYMICTLKF